MENWSSSISIKSLGNTSSIASFHSSLNDTVRSAPILNSTVCGGCTVSAVGATIAWWYPTSLYYGFSSLVVSSSAGATGYVVTQASTYFDLENALKQETWLKSTTFDARYNSSGVQFVATTLDLPRAASTSALIVTAVDALPTDQILSSSQIADAYLDPMPIASVSFTGPANTTSSIIASGTPFLVIPAYAILTASRAMDGSCRQRTIQYNLPEPYHHAYDGSANISSQLSLTESALPEDFLARIPMAYTHCNSLLIAEIEMLVVVTLIYDSGISPFLVHVENSVTESADSAAPTSNNLTTSTVHTSGDAIVAVCGGIRCFPVIAIAHQESTVTAPLEGPGPVTRVIEPITTSTGHQGESVTIFGQAPGDGETSQGGDDSNGSNSGASSNSGSQQGGGSNTDNGDDGGSQENGGTGGFHMIPLVAHVESALPVTFFVSASRAITEVTVSFQGQTLVATAEQSDEPNPTVAGLVTAIQVVNTGHTGPTPTSDRSSQEQGGNISQSGSNEGADGQSGASGQEQGSAHGNAQSSPQSTGSGESTGTGFAVTGETSGFTPSRPEDGNDDNGEEGVNGTQEGFGQSAEDAASNVKVLTVGSQTFTANGQSEFALGNEMTLSPGKTLEIHGTTVALDPGGSIAVINGATQTVQAAHTNPPPMLVVGTQTFVANAATQYYLDSDATLTPGGKVTYHGSSISLGVGAEFFVVNGETSTFGGPQITPPPVLLVAGTSYTADAGSTYYVEGQTLTPGGDIVVDGTKISLASDANYLTVDGVTLTRPPQAVPAYPVLTLGETTVTPEAVPGQPGSSEYVFGGYTLLPGGSAAIFSGTTFSLLPFGGGLVVNGATSSFSSILGATTSAPVLTIDGNTYTALDYGGTSYDIDGLTLTPGGIITVHGQTISLAPQATVLVVNGQTTTLFPATGTVTTTSTVVKPAAQASGSPGAAITSGTSGTSGTHNLQSAAPHLAALKCSFALFTLALLWLHWRSSQHCV